MDTAPFSPLIATANPSVRSAMTAALSIPAASRSILEKDYCYSTTAAIEF
jgi:hypothetical protein